MKESHLKFEINISKIREEIESKIMKERENNLNIIKENYICLKKQKPTFDINIKELYKENKEKTVEPIEYFKEHTLNNYEKKPLELREEYSLSKIIEPNNSLDYSNSESTENKDNNDTGSESEHYEEENSLPKKTSNPQNSFVSGLNNIFINRNISSELEKSEKDNSPFNGNVSNSKNSLEGEQIMKKFNYIRDKFYQKNKLYDLPLYEEGDKEKNIFIPEKYRIGENYGFLYPNDITTNFITRSAFIEEQIEINVLNIKDIENSNYYYDLGLYFCGKEVILDDEKQLQKCSPNEFICKRCMDINKKKYNIKDNNLINIIGRVSKINKGHYHCFGHFLCGNQIEDCINKFSCKACKKLDLYSKYYNE